MDDIKKRIAQFEAGMLKIRVWVIFNKPLVSLDKMLPVLPDHYEWIIAREKEGLVVGSGPLLPVKDGDPATGEGLTIIRADSYQEAVEIAQTDPFAIAGLRNFEVRPWQINEGSVEVSVKFSNNSYTLR